jgi:hypothetical protein
VGQVSSRAAVQVDDHPVLIERFKKLFDWFGVSASVATVGFGRGAGGLVVGTMIGLGAVQVAAARVPHATGGLARGASAAAPSFGNPNGRFPVPLAGRAVNTRHPDQVVGDGRPASCTSAAVVRAVAAGGTITFNCGSQPITIVMRSTARVVKTRRLVVLDGGGLVTLSGAGKRRILYSDTCAGSWSTDDCVDQPYPRIVVQNITFEHGYDRTHQATCTANTPRCWYGGVDGGGAVYVEGGQFKAVDSRFIDNRCYAHGPDLGGGAIRALAEYKNRPIYITNDTFRGGRCSNGGALSSISVQWNILNSEFVNNKAIGWGANPASSGTAGGGSGGAVYLDGKDDNVLIAGTKMNDNQAREGGGAIFDVVDTGWCALRLDESHLHHNISGQFQTFPGIYYEIDGKDTVPVMTHSTAN